MSEYEFILSKHALLDKHPLSELIAYTTATYFAADHIRTIREHKLKANN